MAKISKKVVMIIVEGNSDEPLLYERLKELFSPTEIRFEPYHGDLFNDSKNRNSPIKEVIGSFINAKMQRLKGTLIEAAFFLHL